MKEKNILKILTNTMLAVFLLCTVLPLPLNYSSIAIISAVVFSGADKMLNQETLPFNKKFLFLLTIPFFVYLLGLINTSNLESGIDFLVRNLSFLAFPVIFYAFGHRVQKDFLMVAFAAGLILTDFYLIYLFFYYYNFGEKFYRIVSEEIYHSTYLGIYNLMAYWIFMTSYQRQNRKIGYLLLSVIFLITAVMTSARIIFIMAIISALLTVILLIKSVVKRVVAIFLISASAALILISTPAIHQKFDQVRELDKIRFDASNYESLSSRLGKIEATISVIARNPWTGTGTGDLMDELKKVYKEMRFTMGLKHAYNPHNQYLDNLARNGFIGGGLALAVLYLMPLYYGVRRKHLLLTGFWVIMAGVSLTESILDVHKGITFYAFFAAILFHDLLEKEYAGKSSG